jgi:hypothetical protein
MSEREALVELPWAADRCGGGVRWGVTGRYTGMTIAKYGLTLFIGAVTGLLAFLVQTMVKNGTESKLQSTEWMMNNFGLAWGFATHTAISVSLVLIASCLVRRRPPLRVPRPPALSPGKGLRHQRSSRHAMVPL